MDATRVAPRFLRADLCGVVMRPVELRGTDIDAPWLFNGESFLRVNGVDVIPLVEAELNHRFPGRAGRRARRGQLPYPWRPTSSTARTGRRNTGHGFAASIRPRMDRGHATDGASGNRSGDGDHDTGGLQRIGHAVGADRRVPRVQAIRTRQPRRTAGK